MPRAYLIYGLLVLAGFAYAQYHGWSLGGGTSAAGSRSGGGWHWNWGGSSGSGGGYWGGGGFHK